MKSSVIKAVRNTLLAVSIGAFLPSIASACSVAPGGDFHSSDFTPGAMASLMPSAASEFAVFSERDSKWDREWEHNKGRHWGDQDGDSSTSPTVAATGSSDDSPSTTPTGGDPTATPEPGTLALLGLGAIAVGLGLPNRRTKPV
jgi:PEP-CTERM motif